MSDDVNVYVICSTRQIEPGTAKAFSLLQITETRETRPFSIFVVRTKADQFFGYVNVCPHQGAWLNIGDGGFLSGDGARLRCGRHKAEFDVESGLCVKGSCKDKSLEQIPIDGRGICTTDMRCRRRDLNVGQQSLIRGSNRMTLLRLGLPQSRWRESKAHSGDEGSPALSHPQRRIPRRG